MNNSDLALEDINFDSITRKKHTLRNINRLDLFENQKDEFSFADYLFERKNIDYEKFALGVENSMDFFEFFIDTIDNQTMMCSSYELFQAACPILSKLMFSRTMRVEEGLFTIVALDVDEYALEIHWTDEENQLIISKIIEKTEDYAKTFIINKTFNVKGQIKGKYDKDSNSIVFYKPNWEKTPLSLEKSQRGRVVYFTAPLFLGKTDKTKYTPQVDSMLFLLSLLTTCYTLSSSQAVWGIATFILSQAEQKESLNDHYPLTFILSPD